LTRQREAHSKAATITRGALVPKLPAQLIEHCRILRIVFEPNLFHRLIRNLGIRATFNYEVPNSGTYSARRTGI
jgi:hypothetical protein